MVELAIVMPVLMMVLFAIAEFSLAFLQWQAVANAAREGARAATLHRSNCSASVNAAVNQAVAAVTGVAGLQTPAVALNGACTFPGSSTVTVSVPYTFQIVPNLVQSFGPAAINLRSTSVMANDP